VIILTGDQDILQLVDEGIRVAIMKIGQGNYEVFDRHNFYEKKGISPEQIIDLKGLMGDTADNYPGVKGIGEKTALKLLQEYETIDNLLDNIDK
ncbi:5'-3' exonuclease H3TH domain-containing protein, partial [Wenyingzhuangia sp. 1_MG-2023]|nr:5'-3' exonuclease H3TH domain-containing protein [Wenyingzhuangia sp. 1_MG-2023]